MNVFNPISSGTLEQREAPWGGSRRPALPNSSKIKDRDFCFGTVAYLEQMSLCSKGQMLTLKNEHFMAV